MKILMVTAGMSGGGTERVIATLANYMVGKGHEVSIVMTAGKKVEYQLNSQVNLIMLGERTGKKVSKRMKRIIDLRNLYKRDKKQVVISFGTETNLFAVLAGFCLPVKVHISERNDPNKCSYKWIRNILYHFAYDIIFQTEQARKCFPKFIQKKGVVIPNPLHDKLPQIYVGERNNEFVAVGRLEPQKNYKLLIDAFSKFQMQHKDYKLVIYGQGEEENRLRDYIKQLGCETVIILAGFSKNIWENIKKAKLYVLSSDYEGMPNSLLEALALGVPVLSTDCPSGGPAMLIREKENGILVPVNDPEAMCNAMTELVSSNQWMMNLPDEAVKIKTEYSADKICKQWLDTICKG